MSESRVTIPRQEYERLTACSVLLNVLVEEGLLEWSGYITALDRLRNIAEPVLESTVNTPLIGDHAE